MEKSFVQRKRFKRKTEIRRAKALFVLVTEGKNTEPQYFRELAKLYPGSIIEFRIIDSAGVPKTVVEKAIHEKKSIDAGRRRKGSGSFSKYDQVWAVFDRDEHPDVDNSLAKCSSASIGVAFSDPCFELWLILHKQDFDKFVDRHLLQKMCAEICPGYDAKVGKTADFGELILEVGAAEERARRQYKRRLEEGDPPKPPFTSVNLLTEAIKAAADQFSKYKAS